MKLSKELNDALESVSREVDCWPALKRSIDLQDRKKKTKEPSESCESSQESTSTNRKATILARSAKA